MSDAPGGAAPPSLDEAPGGGLAVHGPMGFDTVAGLRTRADPTMERRLRDGGSVVLDLGRVTRTDSAGLALLVHWSRRARSLGTRLELRNVPAQMMSIARTVGLEGRLMGSGVGSGAAER